MKIKQKIILLFTGLVTVILFFLCVSIYLLTNRNRQEDFRTRLRNRGVTTMSLLMNVPRIDKELLKNIDQFTLVALQQRSVVVYTEMGGLHYQYADENTTPVFLSEDIRPQVIKSGYLNYTSGIKDVVAFTYKYNNENYIVVSSAYDEDGFKKQTRLMYILIFSFLSGVLIAFLVGVFFSNNLVKPIIKITNEVKEISSQNLSKRIILKREKDELFELSSTFNALLKRLQESFDLQKRFIANASHELSTPLTSILSQLEITLQKDRTTEHYKDIMVSVNEDVVRLKHLTKNLLEIARASGSFEGIELVNIRMDELLMKIPSTIKKENSIYNINLQFDDFPEFEENLTVKGNPDLLLSAILNIVQNSCKYSSDHTVYISLHFKPQHLELNIRDNGPGINDSDLPFIFQPFYRGANIEKIQGFGLGLSIAKEIISIHKGSIQYQKNNIGSSFFTITLPLIPF